MSKLFNPILGIVQETYEEAGLDPEAPEVARITQEIVNWIGGRILSKLMGTILCGYCEAVVADLAVERGPYVDGPDLELPFSERAEGSTHTGDIVSQACEELKWAARKAHLEKQWDYARSIYFYELGDALSYGVEMALDEDAVWSDSPAENEKKRAAVSALIPKLQSKVVLWIELVMMRQLEEHLCPSCQRELERVWYGEEVEEDQEIEDEEVGDS